MGSLFILSRRIGIILLHSPYDNKGRVLFNGLCYLLFDIFSFVSGEVLTWGVLYRVVGFRCVCERVRYAWDGGYTIWNLCIIYVYNIYVWNTSMQIDILVLHYDTKVV